MTKYTIDFGYDSQTLRTKKDMKIIQLNNFFLKPPSELVKLGYLPPVVRSISPPIKMSQSEYRYIILVERKPTIENMRSTHAADEVTITIPLPWQHYFVIVSASPFGPLGTKTMAMYFSKSSLSSLDHQFYVPYLPNVYKGEVLHDYTVAIHTDKQNNCGCGDVYCGDQVSIENLCFPAQNYPIEQQGFSDVFDSLYSNYWHGSTFNADLYNCPIDFIQEYDDKFALSIKKKQLDTKVISCLKKIATIPFDTILSDDVFNCMAKAFTFSDYLKAVGDKAERELFDFKSLFEQGLDAGKLLDAVERKYQPFQVNKFANSGVHQDADGKWRRADGKFASYEQIYAVRGY